VGKTHTTTQLLRLLRRAGRSCAGMKPICCGDRRDAELLLAAGSDGLTIAEINPVWLKTPAAPLVAAQREGFRFDLEIVMNAFAALERRVEVILVEGVGGWLVPVAADFYVSDLAVALGLPVLLVAENRLGCLNHTLLTLESISRRGLMCLGVVLNEPGEQSDIATATNREALAQLCKVPVLTGLTEKDEALSPEWEALLATAKRQKLSND
jgi:dethiobiotin synthetase